mgnify:CR=1 FL=1
MVEPERSPYEVELENSLGAMQRCVGGTIEAVYEPGGRDAALICNDEGKLLNLPLNRALGMRREISTTLSQARFSSAVRRRTARTLPH